MTTSKSMTEKQLQDKVVSYLRKQGWHCFKVSDRFRYGTLDLFACRNGVSVWIELKTETGKLSDPQRREIRDLEAQRIPAVVVRSIPEIEALDRQYRNTEAVVINTAKASAVINGGEN